MSDWSTKPGLCGPRSEYLYCITILLASHVDPDLLLLMNMRYQLSLADNDKEATITTVPPERTSLTMGKGQCSICYNRSLQTTQFITGGWNQRIADCQKESLSSLLRQRLKPSVWLTLIRLPHSLLPWLREYIDSGTLHYSMISLAVSFLCRPTMNRLSGCHRLRWAAVACAIQRPSLLGCLADWPSRLLHHPILFHGACNNPSLLNS